MESAVERLLHSAQLREADVEKMEELEMAHLTKEEVAARRAELRQTRELMFRADAKAKRIAKIKSKTYRKIQKKRKDKDALTLDEIADLDPDAAATERLKLETERARERATLRHKNTGKWAQHMKGRGHDLDVDQRRELNEQLERGEQLRRKIQGLDSDGEGAESDSDPDEDVQDIANRAANDVDFPDGLSVAGLASGKKKGIMDMKFMVDAAAREDRIARDDADDFKAEMLGLAGEGDDDELSLPDNAITDSISIQGNAGRMLFRPADSVSNVYLWSFASPYLPHPVRISPKCRYPYPYPNPPNLMLPALRSSHPVTIPPVLEPPDSSLCPQLLSRPSPKQRIRGSM